MTDQARVGAQRNRNKTLYTAIGTNPRSGIGSLGSVGSFERPNGSSDPFLHALRVTIPTVSGLVGATMAYSVSTDSWAPDTQYSDKSQ